MNENYDTYTAADLSAVLFCGADAGNFLQGQLSADIAGLPPGRWLRAAYCSPKGRALATMIVICRGEGDFVALLPSSVADSVADRLSRFVLRAKVKISRPPYSIDARVSEVGFVVSPDGGDARAEDGVLYVDEGGGAELRLRFPSESETSATKPAELPSADSPSAKDDSAWRRMQILRGVPWIGAEMSDRLVPQYFNFDLLGGVNFRKGCYVGQEIIARLHYLGNVRRRGYVLSGEGAPPAAGEKTGGAEIVNAVAADGGFVAFAVAPRDANDSAPDGNGAPELREPPYGLPTAAEDQKPKPKVGE